MTRVNAAAQYAPQTAGLFVRISLFWVGLSFMWGALNIQVLPARVRQLVPTDVEGTAVGVIFAVGLAIAIIVQPVAGAISDRIRLRWGRRRSFMLAGAMAAVPFLIVIGASPSFWLLIVAVVFLQIAANTAHGPYQGVIPDQVRPNARGRASGVFGIANQVGTLLGVLAAGLLLDRGLVLPAVVVVAAVLLVASGAAWRFVKDPPTPALPPFESVLREVRQRLSELRSRPAFGWLVLGRLFFFMGLLAMDNFIRFFLESGLGETDPGIKTSGVLGVVIVVAALTSVPGGWLADRYGRLRVLAGAGGLGALSGVLMFFSQSYLQFLIFGAVLGAGLGLFVAADWATAIDLVPDLRAAGLYMGLTNLATAGGDALATITAGVALDALNRVEPGFGYRAPFALMTLYFALSLAVLPVIRARLRQSRAAEEA